MAVSMPRDQSIPGRRFSYAPSGRSSRGRWSFERHTGFFTSAGYGVFVGVMKVLLPAMAAVFVLLLLAWPELDPGEETRSLKLSELTVERPESLSMLNARFSGFDEQNRPFSISADVARQFAESEDLIALELPKADITLRDGTWMALTAREGIYDRELQTMDLSGDVTFFHERGFEMHGETAEVDLLGGTAMSREPVAGQGVFGTIEAAGFDSFDQGNRIVFLGPTRLVLFPESLAQLPMGQQ